MPGSESIVARHRQGEGAVVASNLLHRDGHGECVQTGAAILLRNLHPQNAEFSQCPDSVHGQLLCMVPGTGVRLDLHFAERAQGSL